MVNFNNFSSENTVIFDDFSPKITVVRPKYVPPGFYSRGGSIDADTVYNFGISQGAQKLPIKVQTKSPFY